MNPMPKIMNSHDMTRTGRFNLELTTAMVAGIPLVAAREMDAYCFLRPYGSGHCLGYTSISHAQLDRNNVSAADVVLDDKAHTLLQLTPFIFLLYAFNESVVSKK